MNAERNENRNDSHLPECIYEPEHFDTEQNIVWGWRPCICDALSACEQRVRDHMLARIVDRMTDIDTYDLVCDDGKEYFWAAIRALKEKP